MKYIFLLLWFPLLSYAGGEEAEVPDYSQIHKPYFSRSCIDENTQQEMDQCGKRSLIKVMSRMNKILDLLKNNYINTEPDLFKLLQVSQVSWKSYMESNCKVETYDSRNGTGFNSIWNACLETKINERISFLSLKMENP